MPMNFEIVTDSSCNLVEDMIDEFGLHILPLTFMVDGEQYQSYLKGQHTDLKQFYTMMRDGKVIKITEGEAAIKELTKAEEIIENLPDIEEPKTESPQSAQEKEPEAEKAKILNEEDTEQKR